MGRIEDVFPGAGEQRYWFHASGNVIDCLPSAFSHARGLQGEVIEAPARAEAHRALEDFREEHGFKYPKALAKLDRVWKPLTALLRPPSRAPRNLGTTNPIESSIATVRLRDPRTRAPIPRAPAMAYKLLETTQERWRRFNSHKLVADGLSPA